MARNTSDRLHPNHCVDDSLFSRMTRTPRSGSSYRWFILSTFTMTLAAQIQGVSSPVADLRRHADPLSLGLIGSPSVPYISIAPSPAIADRQNRRAVSLASWRCPCAARLPAPLSLGGSWRELVLGTPTCGRCTSRSFPVGSRAVFFSRLAGGRRFVPPPLSNAVAGRSSTWQTGAVAARARRPALWIPSPSLRMR
jgi:hypothetical protein